MNIKHIVALSLLTAVQSFAIFGVGGHFVTSTSSIDPAKSDVYTLSSADVTGKVVLDQQKVDGLSGFGVKLWIDIIPFVDVEATGNMQFSRYSSVLHFQDANGNTLPGAQPVPIELEFVGVPFLGKARPVFSAITGDLSVTYPFTMLPVVRPYVGAGVSYIASTPVMNQEFTRKFLEKAGSSLLNAEGLDQAATQKLALDLGEALADEGLNTGIGAHAILGIRAKLPLIPLAAYANSKYYFGGNFDEQYNQGIVFEIGAGFAL
jgi:hypothetical protein